MLTGLETENSELQITLSWSPSFVIQTLISRSIANNFDWMVRHLWFHAPQITLTWQSVICKSTTERYLVKMQITLTKSPSSASQTLSREKRPFVGNGGRCGGCLVLDDSLCLVTSRGLRPGIWASNGLGSWRSFSFRALIHACFYWESEIKNKPKIWNLGMDELKAMNCR